MALYHVNLGAPQIGPRTKVEVGATSHTGLPGTADFTFCKPAAAKGQTVRVRNYGADAQRHFRLWFDTQYLPWLQFHRRVAAAGGGLFCIEPATHDSQPREELLRDEAPLDGTVERDFRLVLGYGPEAAWPDGAPGRPLSRPHRGQPKSAKSGAMAFCQLPRASSRSIQSATPGYRSSEIPAWSRYMKVVAR